MKLETVIGLCPVNDNELSHFLDSLPPRPPRSRLEPFAALIDELRRRGWTYRQLARLLAEKCQLHTSASNIHHFVTRRELRAKHAQDNDVGKTACAPPAVGDSAAPLKRSADTVQRIIARQAREHLQQPAPTGFDFDPSEPLRLLNPKKH